MNAFIPVIPVDKEIYVREYHIPAECFPCNMPVQLIAECAFADERYRDCGFYELNFYFSVGDYAARDHVVGVCFGKAGMSRSDIDQEIDDFACSEIDEQFISMVERYLQKELLWEKAQDL